MPKYRIPALSFIDDHIVEEGAIIDFDGEFIGSEWELIEDATPAKASKAKADDAAE